MIDDGSPTSEGEQIQDMPSSELRTATSAEVWLQVQNQMSHLIAQKTSDAFVAIDTVNRVIYWNHGAECMFGWRADEIIGKSLDLIVPQSKRAQHNAGVHRLSSGHEPRLVGKMTNVVALHRDGEAVDIELSLTSWVDPSSGKPAGYASIMRDVKERRRLEDERDAYGRKLEEQLAAIEATSDGVAMTDPDGFFIYTNLAHAAIFGFENPAAMIGQHWSVLYSAEEAARIESHAIPEVLAKGNWCGEARGIHRNGNVIEQEISLSRSPNGGLVCTTRDIGERQRTLRERIRAREQLILAERQEIIGRAVAGLAHDLANLLAVISVSAATLDVKLQSCPTELQRLKDAATQATAMLDMIMAPAQTTKPHQVVDAKSILSTVLDLTALSLKPHHTVRLKLPQELVLLQADQTEFLRVMMNLCSNARDSLAPEKAGKIEICLEKFDRSKELPSVLVGAIPKCPAAVMTVSDTGCGIAPQDLAHIFEPFHTTKSFGTGLGLAAASSIVAEAGGCISVESSELGSTFKVIWPLALERTPFSLGTLPDPSSAAMLSGKRILAVDDNDAVLDLVADELRNAGAEVATCSAPAEILAVLEDDVSNWDALVVDYDMPGMNGAELAAVVAVRWPWLPVILCTALHDTENSMEPDLFAGRVTKSALATELPQVLQRILSNYPKGVA